MANPFACSDPATGPSSAASAAAINFVAADTTNIALAGTGGVGRQELSRLTFKVFDAAGRPVSGATVGFEFADAGNGSATAIGGLSLSPATATSASDGSVSTMVSGGTVPTSIRVRAAVGGFSTLSNVLVVSTGVPTQEHFSLATSVGNCEGGNFDQDCSTVTVTLGDHFGNPVPDGTAVSFSAEGGVIDASCLTGALPTSTTPAGQSTNSKLGPGSGACSVTLRSASPRPSNGRVTVLAYALGEEDFFDANGNNRCDGCDNLLGPEFSIVQDRGPSFRDDDENRAWSGGEPCIGLYRSDVNCSTPGDGKYNGVLRSASSSAAQTVYVSKQAVLVFAGSYANVSLLNGPLACSANGSVDALLQVADANGNPMPAGTKIELASSFGTAVSQVLPASHEVGNYPLGIGGIAPVSAIRYLSNIACPSSAPGRLFVKVTTPNNVVSQATLPIN